MAYGSQTVGFSREPGAGGADLFNGPSHAQFATWDMLSPIGPISGSGYLLQWHYSPIDTTGGILIFNDDTCDATFTAALPTTPAFPGLVFMPQDAPDFGYSVNDADLVYFYSFDFVQSFNTATGGWSIHMPMGWIYFDWPFYYELDPGVLWFALPPESGLWVYHFSTGQWEMLPLIIP